MELIISLIPHAVAVALSPMPIAALILLLLSKKAKLNSIAFLAGWVIALVVNVGLFMFIFNEPVSASKSKPDFLIILQILLGIFLLIFAFKEWKMRPKSGIEPKMPGWMKKIVNLSPAMAFVIAFGLVSINAKNTVIDITAGVEIGQKAKSIEEALSVLAVYVIIASSTIFIPVIAFLLFGDKLNKKLESLKTWFLGNNAYILFALFLILGLDLIYKAFKTS